MKCRMHAEQCSFGAKVCANIKLSFAQRELSKHYLPSARWCETNFSRELPLFQYKFQFSFVKLWKPAEANKFRAFSVGNSCWLFWSLFFENWFPHVWHVSSITGFTNNWMPQFDYYLKSVEPQQQIWQSWEFNLVFVVVAMVSWCIDRKKDNSYGKRARAREKSCLPSLSHFILKSSSKFASDAFKFAEKSSEAIFTP